MKAVLIALLLFVPGVVSAQKDKIEINKKTEVVSIDGIPAFILEGKNMGNTQILKGIDGQRLAVFQVMDYYDSKHISSGNPKGRVTYYDVTFLNEALDKCEIPVGGFKKQLAKYILDYNLVKDKVLDEEAVKQFVAIHGMKFSDEKNRSTTVIIVR